VTAARIKFPEDPIAFLFVSIIDSVKPYSQKGSAPRHLCDQEIIEHINGNERKRAELELGVYKRDQE
jgi:hypothetical protein